MTDDPHSPPSPLVTPTPGPPRPPRQAVKPARQPMRPKQPKPRHPDYYKHPNLARHALQSGDTIQAKVDHKES
jgi:hypothetical protein